VRRRGYTIGSQTAVRLSALRAGHPLTPGRFLVLISGRGCVDPRAIVRLEGLDQLKYLTNSSGIEPATFWLVSQCLKNNEDTKLGHRREKTHAKDCKFKTSWTGHTGRLKKKACRDNADKPITKFIVQFRRRLKDQF
jgi:hypothetical protein